MEKAGFIVYKTNVSGVEVYRIKYSYNLNPIVLFPKKIDHVKNPFSQFMAVFVDEHADLNIKNIKGTYNLSAGGAGLYAMVPLLCGAAGNIFSGWLVDRLYAGGQRHLSRKLPAIAGFLLTAVGMIISVQQTSVGPAVFWLSVAVFGVDMILSPSWSFCIDIGGQHAGQVSGTMNMAGNIGSAIIGPAFPVLLHLTGSADFFFYLIAVFSVLAALCWVVVDPARKIEELAPV